MLSPPLLLFILWDRLTGYSGCRLYAYVSGFSRFEKHVACVCLGSRGVRKEAEVVCSLGRESNPNSNPTRQS